MLLGYQFPYQAGVFTNPLGAFCGGFLISTTRVVTAAHCILQPSSTVNPFTDVLLGILDLDGTSTEPDGVLRTATKVLPHPLFTANIPRNDDGLIFINEVPLNTAINTIALPSISSTFLNAGVSLSGWGLTSNSANRTSETLKYVNTFVISNKKCRDQLPVSGLLLIRDEHICTHGNPTGSKKVGGCHGDSGGPVTTIVNGIPTLIGIVSFGPLLSGCESGLPSVSTRITTFLTWINDNQI